jgi:hypothetical protein
MRFTSFTALLAAALMTACGGGSDPASNHGANSSSTLLASAGAIAAASASPVEQYGSTVQQLYIAYFGRPADPAGLTNFAASLSAASAPTNLPDLIAAYTTNAAVKNLIDSFGTSAESQKLYAGDTTAFVTAVFNNVLSRPPQTAGLNFWVNAINSGTLTKGNAALSIMAGALVNTTPQGLLDAALVNKKISLGSQFTASIMTSDQINAYKGSAAAASVRTMLSSVTGDTDVNVFQATINTTLDTLVAQAPLTSIPTTTTPLPEPVFELEDTAALPSLPGTISPVSLITPSATAAANFLTEAYSAFNFTIISVWDTVDCPTNGQVRCPGFNRVRYDSSSNRVVSDSWAFEPVKQSWLPLSASNARLAGGDIMNYGNGWSDSPLDLELASRSIVNDATYFSYTGGLKLKLNVAESSLSGSSLAGTSNVYSADAKAFKVELEQTEGAVYELYKSTGFWKGSDDAKSYPLLASFRAAHAITTAPFCMQRSLSVSYGIVFNPFGRGAAVYKLSGFCTSTIVGEPLELLNEGVTTVNGRKVIVLSKSSYATTKNNQFNLAIALDADGVASEGYRYSKGYVYKLSDSINRTAMLDFMKAKSTSSAAWALP